MLSLPVELIIGVGHCHQFSPWLGNDGNRREGGGGQSVSRRRRRLSQRNHTAKIMFNAPKKTSSNDYSYFVIFTYCRKNSHAECWLKATPELHTSERTALTTFDLSSMVNSEVIAQSLIRR